MESGEESGALNTGSARAWAGRYTVERDTRSRAATSRTVSSAPDTLRQCNKLCRNP